jgi:arsenite methyltransferase
MLSIHAREILRGLEIVCGVGITSCYIAKRYGCRVVGVDISGKMIDWSKERARREGLENRVEFRIANVQNLPFEDAIFDVIIGEPITVFLKDKQKGVGEYVRMTKRGGHVGLNEMTWIKVLLQQIWLNIILVLLVLNRRLWKAGKDC